MKTDDIVRMIDEMKKGFGGIQMPETKYKFSRSNWYEATLPKDGQAAFAWCVEMFGPEPYYPDAWSRWYLNVNRTFRFSDAKDYEWFMLRWAS